MPSTNNKSYKINVCGIGPGNPDLIVPQVFRLVAASHLVIGGGRHIATFDVTGKETVELRNNIPEIIQRIKLSADKQVTVLVSGDTGFHSLLRSLLGHFTANGLNVVPGISTYQYFFAKIAMTYEDAWIGSVHGQQLDYVAKVKTHRKVFLLTDNQNSWQHIAENLSGNQLGNCMVYVGNRLSYTNETIVCDTAENMKTQSHNFDLCAVIIVNENRITND
jgi:cobalt-precorrin-7 (C5)-methyltransferase